MKYYQISKFIIPIFLYIRLSQTKTLSQLVPAAMKTAVLLWQR